ncbi:zinc metallopeptidase [Haloplasma contractile]|uniref:Neutral zinc metallopeptidase protein n=1 Tax=Haloplasma contractile SSD-17B TaxID=1033810 RepID=U2FD43_9MOLU|nr:zinc metallopeptidase [Haloplasma contractile]ERJ10925.1 Putative neutral zinc metallopeptidase protein [Haloplasma contractile SSD-17B]
MLFPYGFYGFDPTIIILIPTIVFTLYAQSKVKSNFAKYLKVNTHRGYSGVQVARSLLDEAGLQDIPIELAKGHLSDHYDPRNRVLRLSQEVYNRSSIASVSVSAHEVGHAIQHARGYIPLTVRNLIFPLARFGSSAAWFFIIGGLLIPNQPGLLDIGILLFGAAVLFQVITLPVEFNASSRALRLLNTNQFIMDDEERGARRVLRAAALTYVAAMAAGIAQLLRLLVLRNRR